ncbi:MAG: MBL fold metallo-hydrolase, partial [Acidobacteria bacterium]|nr:MBL fold metallo-hydrolase [Acidobacteriota bacterium]
MNHPWPAFALITLLALASVPPVLAQQSQGPPMRSITRITGDLYRVQNNDHYTVFLVTPAGIILADPINVEAAIWIKAQLTERFPNAPVRYVLYSHHHQDHASGAAVFNDTAELVGHENFNAALKASAGQNEAAAKRFAAVVPPESTYSGRRMITLGGKSVQMIHPGRTGHAPDQTMLHFPAERVVFGVDFISVKMVPGSNTMAGGASIAEYVSAVKAVEALDFTIAAPGHGPMGTKADIVAHRQYFENLAARVAAGIKAGRTVEQLQAARIMDEYKDWIEYDEDNDVNIANA